MRKILYVIAALFFILLLANVTVYAQDYAYYNSLAKKEYESKNYYNAIDYATRSLGVLANGEAYWWRGMSRYFVKNYAEAVNDFSNALNYYSSDRVSLGTLYSWRGDSKNEQGLYKAAIDDYELALSYGYENKKHIYWNEAAAYYNTGEYEKAVDNYTKAINSASASEDIARLYKERGDVKGLLFKYDDAIADYSKAIDNDARYFKAFWQRGYYRAKNLQYELAIGDLTSAIRLLEQSGVSASNDLSIMYNNRGLYYYYLGKYDVAKLDLQQSLNQNPNYDYANWNMGRILNALHDYKTAGTYYLQAVSLMKKDIDRASCYADLYWTDRAMLDYGQALAHINEAIQLNPGYRAYYWNRAYLYGIRKQYTNALQDYDKVISLYSNDTTSLISLYIERGLLKGKMNDNPGGLRDLQKAVELNPAYYNSYYEIGRFFKEVIKQNDLALINLQKAAILSIVKDTTSNYAYAKAVKGDKQEAIRVIESLVQKESTNYDRLKWELYNAACIHALTGNQQKALEYLEQSFVAGYDNFDHLMNDKDLDSLKQLPVYKSLSAKYKVPVPKY